MSAPVRVGRGHRRVGGDLEHGDDALVGESDLGDEGFDGCLAFGGGATGHDRGEVVADLGDGAGWWRCGLGGEVGVEFGVPGVELPTTVYNEGLSGALYIDRLEEVQAYAEVWNTLMHQALGVEESRKLMQEIKEKDHD
ncbi:Scr1 family TA system antitoxin-like transcriptional regulator [Micromonospora sp. NPDC002296]|uniref:Scr1 family TA system antitoxin-like transcriptional regulator n=1 Tax=Micromonospora sp. NPDC002296 TaxID=3154271 RepID=UPI003320FD1A